MAEGDRPDGSVLVKLVAIVGKSVHDPSTIDTFATAVSVKNRVNFSGNMQSQLTSLIDVAADQAAAWEALLAVIDDHLKPTRYYGEFLKWREQSGLGGQDIQDGPAKISQAVSEVRKLRSFLLEIRDPRDGNAHLQAMRASIIEIKEAIEAMASKASRAPLILATSEREAAAARGEILFCCEKALREVDLLLIDIIEAGRQSTRMQREYRGEEVFAAESSLTRHLLNDRGRVDLESGALLQAMDRQLARLGIPGPGADRSAQAVPPRAESGP